MMQKLEDAPDELDDRSRMPHCLVGCSGDVLDMVHWASDRTHSVAQVAVTDMADIAGGVQVTSGAVVHCTTACLWIQIPETADCLAGTVHRSADIVADVVHY